MIIAMFGHKSVPSRSGGIEVAVSELSSRMAALGHKVVCYNRGGRGGRYGDVLLRSVPVLPFRGAAAVTSAFFAAVCSAFSDARVVHIHGEGPAFFCAIPKLFGKQVVVTVHGLDWKRQKWQGTLGRGFLRSAEAMTARFADTVIVLSRNAQTYFREIYNRDTVYIPNGVCLPARQGTSVCERLGLETDEYFLFLGRLVPEKGVHLLIEAFRQVKTDKKLLIVGASSDTDGYVARLTELAKDDARVCFCGPVQAGQLEELYSHAWCYVLPSFLEGMPLSLLEALACGCCCLVSDIPECSEVAGDCAMTVPAGNKNALTHSLQRLCREPDLVAAFREKARKKELPDWDAVTEQTLRIYEGGNLL